MRVQVPLGAFFLMEEFVKHQPLFHPYIGQYDLEADIRDIQNAAFNTHINIEDAIKIRELKLKQQELVLKVEMINRLDNYLAPLISYVQNK